MFSNLSLSPSFLCLSLPPFSLFYLHNNFILSFCRLPATVSSYHGCQHFSLTWQIHQRGQSSFSKSHLESTGEEFGKSQLNQVFTHWSLIAYKEVLSSHTDMGIETPLYSFRVIPEEHASWLWQLLQIIFIFLHINFILYNLYIISICKSISVFMKYIWNRMERKRVVGKKARKIGTFTFT